MLKIYKKALGSSLILPFCASVFCKTWHLPDIRPYDIYSLTFK